VLFNFGWFREQFCIIMCPYGRFQNVLMDSNSLTVVYRAERGEPRRDLAPAALRGDCISCNRCVEVCPTGIDIRNGLQMECIGCTACIDACDEIMTKVNKPCGLIQYGAAVAETKADGLRPRVLAYFGLIVALTIGLAVTLAMRKPYSITVLRGSGTPYQVAPDGNILNHFKIHFLNQSHEAQTFEIQVPEEWLNRSVKLTQALPQHNLKAGESREVHLFVTFPREILDTMGKAELEFKVHELVTHDVSSLRFVGVGPL